MARSKPTIFEQLREETRPTSTERSLTTSSVLRWLIIAVSIVATALLFPGRTGNTKSQTETDVLLGTVWTQETVVADYAFPVRKSADVLETERERARRSSPPYFRTDSSALDISLARIAAVTASTSADPLGTLLRRRGEPTIRALFQSHDVIDRSDDSINGDRIIAIVNATTERAIPVGLILDADGTERRLQQLLADVAGEYRDTLVDIIHDAVRPELVFDGTTSQRMAELSAVSVPSTVEIVRGGDVIIRKGDRVDRRALARLSAFHDAAFLRSTIDVSIFVVLGSFLHAGVIIGILVLFLAFVRRTSFDRNGQLASLLSIPVIGAAMGWASVIIPTEFPLEYVILAPAFSMIVAVLYDARTAFVTTVVMALSVAGARGNDYAIALVLLLAGTVAAYSSNRIQHRARIFTSIIAIFISLAVVTLALAMERSIPADRLWQPLVLAAINSVLSPLVTIGVIVLMERVFNVATDMRLDEFDDIGHPLLQQLSERAPGTYQHTLAVARLSEAAAKAIGANALLAKVGALFHDIGKLEKSEYFVENQIDIDNKHDKLPPKKSASIIRQHVQDGIELARSYRLPERIWTFIPKHHGTMLIKHFYARALDESLLKDAVIDEQDYRYPGPKPDSRETAIVMLADAAEALSRLVNTSQREDLEEAVDKIILDRLSDGQFSEAPLTTADLDLIKEAFVRNLLASSHQRVRYREPQESSDGSTAS
ncbi:MAG TPA: HDIG domain-containing protein [Chlorobiota bacterium]|nr:HDIG domain-containing protein [Chlorobiota bacterium]